MLKKVIIGCLLFFLTICIVNDCKPSVAWKAIEMSFVDGYHEGRAAVK
tara:strand:- start:257 stop:400 length:144 start_codon:yes stop_codon:yes gene_type:complete